MTDNWASAVVNVLILAYFVVVALGIGMGVYAARTLKKAEALAGAASGAERVPAPVGTNAVSAPTDGDVL